MEYRSSGESLVPDLGNGRSMAIFEEAASIELTHFDHFAQPLVLKKIIARLVLSLMAEVIFQRLQRASS
jgi:hypothetical protein